MRQSLQKFNLNPFAILFYLMVFILLEGCKLDDPGASDDSPALQLRATQNLSLVELSWDEVRVTGFKEYVLLHSSDDIPDSPTPEVNQQVAVLARFDDVSVTSFSAANTLFTPNTCYKLYCSVGERFLYSPTVCVSQQLTIFPGFYDRVAFEQGQPEIAMFDRLNSQLTSFTLETGTVNNTVPEFNLSFPVLDVSTHQSTTSLFTFDQNHLRISKYSFPQLGLLASKNFSEGVLGGTASGPFVFASIQNPQAAFQVLDRNTFALKDSRTGVTTTRNLAVFQGDPITVLEIWESGINRYEINSLGKVIREDKFIPGVNQVSSQNTCDVSAQHYLGGRFATLVSKEGDVITSLIKSANAFSFLCRLIPDQTKALVIFQEANVIRLDVYDIAHIPSATKLKSFDLPPATFSDLFVLEDIIHVMGVSFTSGSAQSFILRFPL